MKSGNTIRIEAVNPRDLSEADFVGINEVSQDMWGSESWLGELVQCNDCGKMHSKEAVFGHLSAELQRETVARIMRRLWVEDIPCGQCGGETHFIYGPRNVEMIKERVLQSVDSFLVLCRNETDQIVGFEEGYIDTIENIFRRDLFYHYKHVGVEEIKSRVTKALGYTPEHLLLLSSIGLIGPYQSFPNLLEIMNQFSRSLPESYIDMPGITELNRKGVTYKMSEVLNIGVSLGIDEDPELQSKIADIGENFESDLVVYPDPVRIYKATFTQWLRHFLGLAKRGRGFVLPKVRSTPELVTTQ